MLTTPSVLPKASVASFGCPILAGLLKGLLQSPITYPDTPAHLLVALSGGVDSSVLLHSLRQLAKRWPMRLTAATVDYGWRGRPAPELSCLQAVCEATETPLVWLTAPSHLPQTEAAARTFRYEQLSRLAQTLQVDAVVTGHHSSDQVETILFRVFRGAGLQGLGGMAPSRLLPVSGTGCAVPLLRPLLSLDRPTLMAYAEQHQLAWYEDPTNQSPLYSRNVIRHELIPLIKQHFPQVEQSILRLSRVAAETQQVIAAQVEAVWPLVFNRDENSLIAQTFSQLQPALQQPVLRRFLISQGITGIAQAHADNLMAFVLGDHRTRQLDSGLFSLGDWQGRPRFMAVYQGMLRVVSQPNYQQQPNITLDLNNTDPFCVTLPTQHLTVAVQSVVDGGQYWVDSQWRLLAHLKPFRHLPISLRTRRPGDRLLPLGMMERQRLKKFLMNAGIPRFERDTLPLLACGQNILWIPGLFVSQDILTHTDRLPTHYLCAGGSDSFPMDDIQATVQPIAVSGNRPPASIVKDAFS